MNTNATRIAIVGLGKIARDQHVPVINANRAFELVATVSRRSEAFEGVPHYSNLASLISKGPRTDAVVLCTPPQVRFDIALQAIDHGLHVFLEKPPSATLSEVKVLAEHANRSKITIFASWHSRFAAGVAPARAWLAERKIKSTLITWREDVRLWHPRQQWIWEPGSLGVFDPGINALSIATEILPRPLILLSANLFFPTNRSAPIAADIVFKNDTNNFVLMDLDWRHTGAQTWEIVVETDDGQCHLSNGGAALSLPTMKIDAANEEYVGLYKRFADLIARGQSEVDVRPLELVADAFINGRMLPTEPFID